MKTFDDKHWTENGKGTRALSKPLAQKLVNKPIAEKFPSARAYFLNLYDKGDMPARANTTLNVAGASTFIQRVVSALDEHNEIPPDSVELPEGKLSTVTHLRRERNPKVRKMLLDSRRKDGLRCDICGMSRSHLSADLQEVLFEAHHTTPLADTGERRTRLEDLYLLCGSCHRLIHRIMSTSKGPVSAKLIRQLLQIRGVSPRV